MLDSFWIVPIIAVTGGVISLVIACVDRRFHARMRKIHPPLSDLSWQRKIETDINMGQLERNIKLLQRRGQ